LLAGFLTHNPKLIEAIRNKELVWVTNTLKDV
jgi:hypothetical protein